MNNKTAFGNVIDSCYNCLKLICKGDKHYYVRYEHAEFCLCEQCVTVINPEPQAAVTSTGNGVAIGQISGEAVPIKPLCAWLAANALQRNCLAQYAKDWENDLRKWMREREEQDGTD